DRPEGDTPPALVLDDLAAVVVAHALIGAQIEHVGDLEAGDRRPRIVERVSELGHVARTGTATTLTPRRSPAVPSSGDRFQALGEAPGVGLLRPGQRLQPLGDLLKALVARRLGEPGV